MKREAETRVTQPQATDAWSHRTLREARKDSPLEPSGSMALPHVGFELLASYNCERINV